MPEVDGTCEYVLDPDDPETWGGEEGDECHVDEDFLNEDGVWPCPHDTDAETDHCIFHRPVEEKDDEAVITAFLDTLNNADGGDNPEKRHLEFLGAKFGALDLSAEPSLTIEDGELAMSYAEVAGVLNWSGLEIDASAIHLTGIQCLDYTDFRYAKFGGGTDFRYAEFQGDTNFVEAEFRGEVLFFGARFQRKNSFEEAEFRNKASFLSAEFYGDTNFIEAEFRGEARLSVELFGGDTEFTYVDFHGDTSFVEVEFQGESSFRHTEFDDRTSFTLAEFRDETSFYAAEFRDFTDFNNVAFDGDTDFRYAEFDDDALFIEAAFSGGVDFSPSAFDGDIDFRRADLTDATFAETSLCNAHLESAALSRATLFGADLRGAKLSGAILGDVRINEDTQFLGYPDGDSDSSVHTLSAIRSRPKCVYDPDYEEDNKHADVDKAKSVYRALEELGGKHARPRLQARSFVRRQDLQKDEYKQDAKKADSWEERLIAGARWSRAQIARTTLLYGESPWRVISWSLGIILGFALLFPLGGWMQPERGDPITYTQIASNPVEILDSVYYSTLTYTALGFGDFQPVGLGKALTTVETGLGAVMLALLVFILGRRAAR